MTPTEIDDLLVEPMALAVTRQNPKFKHAKVPLDFCRELVRAALAAQRTTLTAKGLFIGPEVATPQMMAAANAHPATKVVDGMIGVAALHGALMPAEFQPPNTPLRCWWDAMVAEWQRGDGT